MVVLAIFIVWQAFTPGEPLLPLDLFRDRNFWLAAIAIAAVGFAITAMAFPPMLYAQTVRRAEPDQVGAAAGPDGRDLRRLSPGVGLLTDRVHPRYLAGFGLACLSIAPRLAERR